MQPSRPKILVVDDEPSVLLTVQAILTQEGYDVDGVSSGDEAVLAVREHQFDVVLTDLKMKGVDGLGVLAEVRKRSPNTVTLMMTGYGSVDSALEALQLGAYEYLLKPVEISELKMAVQRSLERKRLSEIDTLYRVSRNVARAHDVPGVEKEILSAAREVLGIRHACLLTLDPEDRLVGLEDRLRDMFEPTRTLARLSAGETVVIGDPVKSACDPTVSPRSLVLVPGIASERLVCILAADNGEEVFDFHASAQRFLQGLADHAALAISNAKLIQELQHNNVSLEAANQKLKELDRLKSQFLSVATHELRTPLSIILGYNSMLADTLNEKLSEDEKETLRESVAACKRLIRLVNSMLDLTQIERGKMRMNFGAGDIRHLVSSVVALFQLEAKAKDVQLRLIQPSRLPKMSMDSERIEQVLINLIGNAMKFTEAGGTIVVAVRPVPAEDIVQISVADSGIGIAPEEQAIIFDEFAQIRRQNAKRDGSGLGLAIAKRIVEAHKGTIWVNSAAGKGSTFTFCLPTRQRVGSAISA
jgi:signal transduction histidine kinase/CheY-like chemotaxis protein